MSRELSIKNAQCPQQEQELQRRSQSQQPRTETHYELEFDNESSIYARKLCVDADQLSLKGLHMNLSEPNIPENGNQTSQRHRHSFAHSYSHNTSRASSYNKDLSTTPITPQQQQRPSRSRTPPQQRNSGGVYSDSPIRTSPERERRKSREEVSLLRQVPEDGGAMVFHQSNPASQSNPTQLEREDDQQNQNEIIEREREQQTRFPVLESPVPHHQLSGHSMLIQEDADEDDDDEEEEQWILDEELARQGLYRGVSLPHPCLRAQNLNTMTKIK